MDDVKNVFSVSVDSEEEVGVCEEALLVGFLVFFFKLLLAFSNFFNSAVSSLFLTLI